MSTDEVPAADPVPPRAGSGSGMPESPSSTDHRIVFERNPVAMLLVDGRGIIRDANRAAGELLGLDHSDLVAMPFDALSAITTDEALSTVPTAEPLRPGAAERRLRHARGHDVWVRVEMVDIDDAGEHMLLLCLDDATGRRNTERLLLHAALHDSLTNLPNRRLLRDRLDTALTRAARNHTAVAVLFVDLDRFKEINDNFGHDVGDEVLVHVASHINTALRANDTVARLGGDEFVIVCEEVTHHEDLVQLAKRLVDQIERPVSVRGQSVRISASIGIAVTHDGAARAEELLRRADLAMFRAKNRHDVSYVFDDESGVDLSAARTQTIAQFVQELRHAIQADELTLHYQPVVRLDGTLLGLEALLRWPHPRLGPLLPHDFLPTAEQAGLIQSLSDWVLRTAIRDAAGWGDPRVRVSVNTWPDQVARPGFVETVEMLLAWAGLEPRGLYLELREPELPDGGLDLANALNRLSALGIGLAVDAVGVEGASFAALRRLPIDTLKVDRTFVAGVTLDLSDAAVVAAVAAAARATGRFALASGVETPEQLKAVAAMGYRSVQGYLAAPPMPLIDLTEAIRTRHITLPDARQPAQS